MHIRWILYSSRLVRVKGEESASSGLSLLFSLTCKLLLTYNVIVRYLEYKSRPSYIITMTLREDQYVGPFKLEKTLGKGQTGRLFPLAGFYTSLIMCILLPHSIV